MEAAETQTPSVSTSDKIALTSAMNDEFGRAECLSNKSMEWTDEKHSLYLKSMEASFVNQYLYESNQRNPPSGQFKILQGGCWGRISFERGDYPNKSAAAAGNNPHRHDVLPADPWIRRLRPQQNPPSKQHYYYCSSHDTEVSDQNFDDVKGGNERSSNRMKMFHSN